MKRILITGIILLTNYGLFAQLLKSSNLNVPASAQPVPNATATEKSAPPQPQNIAPAPSPVPPIYPGAEVKAAEVQRQIINPPSTPSGTQPVQKEPLSPIESTNTLQPNRPQREENSRKNVVKEESNSTNKTFTKSASAPKRIINTSANNSTKILSSDKATKTKKKEVNAKKSESQKKTK